ncbi:hypothetical protein DFQ27_006989 [Actinomortierella ambigua]|uniref:Clavaminate synthase-like protein n=1 Tax=Actinomortierella ambigua TaxID=1343610 RepID=A0A9P6PXJ2_9FUNG|nr:hypothetical protein DFQ27_006989 [Actinomortierella ambigua]
MSQDAFGPEDHCLGLMVVNNLPPEYQQLRVRLLRLASTYAALPETVKDRHIDAVSRYSFGWSHGKERMNDGRPDNSKGSYYANPVLDSPCGDKTGDAEHDAKQHELESMFPEYCRDNIWPTAEELEGFEQAFKDLGRYVVEVGKLVAKPCDAYGKKIFMDIITQSKTTKARLLHYFPQAPSDDADDGPMDSWCGWHLDHGSLTGLTSAMYLDETVPEAERTEILCPDPDAGLYIRNRGQQVVKVSIPRNALAFQTGEALELTTRGNLKATPHCVRGARAGKYATTGLLARNTFAVFMQPCLETVVTQDGKNFGEWTKQVLDRYYEKEK